MLMKIGAVPINPLRALDALLGLILGSDDDKIGSPQAVTFTYDQLNSVTPSNGYVEKVTFRGGGATYHLYYEIKGE